jgi:hypothetical protein
MKAYRSISVASRVSWDISSARRSFSIVSKVRPEQALLKDADEPFGAAVSFRSVHEGRLRVMANAEALR